MNLLERSLMLQGRMATWALSCKKNIKNLCEVEFSIFSQFGEDGIIEWLVEHVSVPNLRFVEFGVESFTEANCRFLLLNRNWKGLVMDGSPENIRTLKDHEMSWRQDLVSKAAFITTENINDLIRDEGFDGEIGLLSIDVDGVDYWIWDAINVVQPAIVVCEFNSLFGDLHEITVPYDCEFDRFKYHYSGAYYGSSISALRQMGEKKGFAFVGTNLNGTNAFFVRKDLASRVLELLDEYAAFPSRHRGGRKEDGSLAFAAAADRIKPVSHLPVLQTTSGEVMKIEDLASLYSDAWLSKMT